MLGIYQLHEMEEMIKKFRNNLNITHDRKKGYDYLNRTHKEFHVKEHVYAKVKSKKSSLKLGSYSKLALWFYGPFEMLAKFGLVAYHLVLPSHLKVHNVFHVSLQRNMYMTQLI